MKGKRADWHWYLEGSVDGDAPPTRFCLSDLPARVGRQADLEVVLPVAHVSSLHAEIYAERGTLWVRDLGSSNGTRLNQQPLAGPAPLADGDIVQFAGVEFVVERVARQSPAYKPTSLLPSTSAMTGTGARSRARALRALIDDGRAHVVFQPIVDLRSGTRSGYELLGRGAHDALPAAPGPLFEIAAAAGLAAELSALFRHIGIEAAASLDGAPLIFVNANPVEVGNPALVASLAAIRQRHPALRLALEVHEATVTDPARLHALRSALADLDIAIAFDDFGAGQARLLELAEAPPDFVKFDMSLIRDIDKAPASRQSMVEKLVRIVKDAGTFCLAEGIESEEELGACAQMGFEFAQGFLLGRPHPAEYWRPHASVRAREPGPQRRRPARAAPQVCPRLPDQADAVPRP